MVRTDYHQFRRYAGVYYLGLGAYKYQLSMLRSFELGRLHATLEGDYGVP